MNAALRLASVLACGLVLAVASGGCVIQLGDDDDGGTCDLPTPAFDVAISTVIDPETLACVEVPWDGWCDDRCGPCPEPPTGGGLSTWGACQSHCTGLGEVECGQTGGCRTAYDHACLLGDGPCEAFTPFLGCFAIDNTGPAPGACEGLDAQECSRRDHCLATYRDSGLCGNGLDDDRDGLIDEADECRAFGVCLPELSPR